MSNDSSHAQWRVDSQTQRTNITPTGSAVDGYDVAFTTGQGHSGVVFVPLTRYTPAQVKEAVQAMADQMDAIGLLTHDSQV